MAVFIMNIHLTRCQSLKYFIRDEEIEKYFMIMARKMYFSYISEAVMPNITTFFTALNLNTHSIAHCL